MTNGPDGVHDTQIANIVRKNILGRKQTNHERFTNV